MKDESSDHGSVPYVEEEVTFYNGEIALAGTLTLPTANAKHPAVVLLQGSGPVNRDEDVFGMKPFAIMADHFGRNGIAVLRYDSRGVGGSTGVAFQYTLSDVAADALAAVRHVKARSEIDTHSVGLCGHSQGGIVAPMCASRSEDVAFIICIAGIGNTGEENFLAQTRLSARADGATEHEVEDRVESAKHVVSLVREGVGRAELRPAVERLLGKQSSPRYEGNDAAQNDDSAIDCALTLFSSPWFRSFLDHDAQPVLESVSCPALLIFGGLDRQVSPKMNRDTMVSAFKKGGNSDCCVRTFPTANHLFQNAKTGSASEYTSLGEEFVTGFLACMSAWILDKALSTQCGLR